MGKIMLLDFEMGAWGILGGFRLVISRLSTL